MTLLVVLLLGGGAVMILSALESNPDGTDVSVLQTIKDIWNDNLSFKNQKITQGPNTSGGSSPSYNPADIARAPAGQSISNAAYYAQQQALAQSYIQRGAR